MNVPVSLEAPPLARRMACWLYEGILLFALLLVATLVFSIFGQMRSAIDSLRPLLVAVLFVVAAAYFSWCWSKGQTLPQRTWRIRVVDRHGQAVTLGRALLRFVYCSMWFAPVIAVLNARPGFTLPQASVLFFGWVATWAVLSRFHPQRQFWHDAWAGTRLVQAERQSAA